MLAFYPNGERIFYGKEKTPNAEYMQYGCLTKVTYPTGATTEFHYEPHDYSNYFTCSYETKVIASVSNSNEMRELINSKTIEDEFIVEEKKIYDLNISYVNESPPYKFPAFDCIIKNESGSSLFTYLIDCNNESESIIRKIELSPGRYKISINSYFDNSCIVYADAFIETKVQKKYYSGGGLRIKKIITSIEDGKSITQKYNYSQDGVSTGLLMNHPVLHKSFILKSTGVVLITGNVIQDVASGVYVQGLSNSYSQFGQSASGCTVGYSRVEEIVEDVALTGKTIYKFCNKPDSVVDISDRYIPNFPNISFGCNGYPLETVVLDKDNIVLKKTEYVYSKSTNKKIKGLKVYNSGFTNESARFVKFYDLESESWFLNRKKNTTYFNGVQDSVVNTSFYEYDQVNKLCNGTRYMDSNRNIIEEKTKYASDFSDHTSIDMRGSHLVNMPIESIMLKNNKIISGKKNEFSEISSTFLPTEIYSLETDRPLDPENYQHKFQLETKIGYYYNGKVLEIEGKDKIPYLFGWGYKFLYPTVIIKNCNSEVITNKIHDQGYYLFEELPFSTNPDTIYIHSLRNVLGKNCEVINYTRANASK